MKAIKIHTMYRDGANYKSTFDELFRNPTDILLDDVKEAIEDTVQFYEPIIVQDYNIKSNAVLENEFIESNSDDHAYMEIVDVEEVEVTEEELEGAEDISSVVTLLRTGGLYCASERRKEAGNSLRRQLKELVSKDGYNVLTVIQIPHSQIKDDVLERMQGKESFTDTDTELGEVLICTDAFNQLLEDKEDDTNETTKGRIADLYEKIKAHDYLMITKC